MRNIRKIFRYIRFTPFDTSNDLGKRDERYRLALLATVANVFSTGLSMITVLITVPLTISYLGEERFGVWMTIASISGLLSFFDLGIGNGLVNRVVHANTSEEKHNLVFVITHGLFVLTLLAIIIGVLVFPLINYIPWELVVKLENSKNLPELRDTMIVFMVIFLASIPLNSLQKIYQGLQIAWKAHLIRGVGSIISLIAVYYLAVQHAGVPDLLAATFGIQTFFPLVMLFSLFRKKLCNPRIIREKKIVKESIQLVSAGGLFLILQIGGLFIWSVDSLILASTAGATSVAKLALIQRLFQFVFVPLAILNAPLWAAFADAKSRGDNLFIKNTLQKTIYWTFLGGLVGVVCLSFLAPIIFSHWMKGEVTITQKLVWSYGLLILLMAVGNSFAMFLNGVGEIKSQIFTVIFLCMIAGSLKYFWSLNYGLMGLIWASIISYLVAVLFPYLTFFRSKVTQHFR